MERFDLIIIGAGPAGLSAAIESAKTGMKVAVFDENSKPGGQLFKQIHKFFGSKEHHAKVRGINIGKELLEEAKQAGAEIFLNATVIGIFPNKKISVKMIDHIQTYQAGSIIAATGASERMIPFPGWTLPGVMGAGAAQTLMNLYGIVPGKRVLMVGCGNVGLVVSYQLEQAGCSVVALIDGAPKIGGYGVHASKVARTGVPFYLSHVIKKAEGNKHVERVTIAEVDSHWQMIDGTEKMFDVDFICIAVGLSPMNKLVRMTGAEMADGAGGLIPMTDDTGATSVKGVFVAGDVGGIEEASSAMIKGRISAIAAAYYTGYIDKETYSEDKEKQFALLSALRQGMFAIQNRGKKQIDTEEGLPLSQNLLHKGYVLFDEIKKYPGIIHKDSIHPVIECTQNIPCNPCQDACKFGCIRIGDHMTNLPQVDSEADCKDCGMCVASCPGQAIFLIDESDAGSAKITLPYEFYPLPEVGEKGNALDRSGKIICEAVVDSIKTMPVYDKTVLLTMKVSQKYVDEARFFSKLD
jgi:thioredoxin reductase/Fe-S-cluster-containing hydrogenase component 2